MKLKKADLSTTLLAIFSLSLTILCTLACGGGGQVTNNGVLELNIDGTIDESLFPTGVSKPKRAPGTFTGLVTNLDEPDETWPLTFTSSNQYSVSIIRKNNIKIEIFINDLLVLSRVYNSTEADTSSLTANINTLTHLQAQLALAQLESNELLTMSSAQASVNQAIFGKTELEDSDYSLSLLAQNNPSAAVIMSTYAQLFNFTDFNLIRGAIRVINQSIETDNASNIQQNYLDRLNALTNLENTTASTIATAHESVKNADNNPIDVAEYASIASSFSLEALTTALASVSIAPTFPDLDTANTASIGVLFNYNFPAATTTDRQGLHTEGYQGVWISTPSGIYDVSGNGGLNIKVIPSSEDVGQTFEYQISIRGANNAGPTTASVQFTVNTLEIIPKERKRIFDQPIAGPVIDDTHLFLVATGDEGYFLDKYSQSEIQADGGATFLNVSRWELPSAFTDVQDMMLKDDLVYLAGGFSGTLAFNTSYSAPPTVLQDDPTYSNNLMVASDLFTLNNQIFTLQAQSDNTYTLHQSDLDLSSDSEITSLEEQLSTSENLFFTTFDDYIYLSGNVVPTAYTLTSTNQIVQLTTLDSSYRNAIPIEDVNDIDAPISLFNGGTINRFNIVANSFSQTSSRTYSTADLNEKRISNGTFFFAPHQQTPTFIAGYSLTSDSFTSVTSQTPSDDLIYFNTLSDKLEFIIQNVPEGIESGKSGAWLYTIGAGSESSFDEGFIRAYKIQPASE